MNFDSKLDKETVTFDFKQKIFGFIKRVDKG